MVEIHSPVDPKNSSMHAAGQSGGEHDSPMVELDSLIHRENSPDLELPNIKLDQTFTNFYEI